MGFRLTKGVVDALRLPESGQAFYRDSDLKGFGLRVGVDSKVYIAEGKLNNRTVRVTIGKHGVFTAEEARNQARRILGQIAKGDNPNEQAREDRLKRVTLQDAFDDFLACRSNLKPLTIRDYKQAMYRPFKDWQRRRLTDISQDMVAKRYADLAATSPSSANKAMRFLRTLFNFAMGRDEDSKGNSILIDNPVRRLSQTRAWHRLQPRQTVIKPHELEPWFRAVLGGADRKGLRTDVYRDYLLLIVLTGLRRQEAASLTWANVDLAGGTLTVPDTKNHEHHRLPLPTFLWELLRSRKDEASRRAAEALEAGRTIEAEARKKFVFAGGGAAGVVVEPRPYMQRVTDASGVSFTLHDLRRTFITVAESLDIPAYALKRLLNHKMRNDVTAGYIVPNVERLRVPMQMIADFMLSKLDAPAGGRVLPFVQPDSQAARVRLHLVAVP